MTIDSTSVWETYKQQSLTNLLRDN